MSDIKKLFAELADAKKKEDERNQSKPANVALRKVQERLRENNEMGELLEVFVDRKNTPKEIIKEVVVEKEVLVEKPSFQQPNPPEVEANFKAIQQKMKFLEQAIGKIAALGPGSGEVNFRYLDDVNRATMTESNDNWVLEYDSATGKVQFTEDIGPIQTVRFNLNHVHDEIRVPGTLCWGATDKTLNLEQPGGVTQQIGQELYVLAKNQSGSTITNGSFVGFAGVAMNGEARIAVAPYLADGSTPNLYGLGVATQDIPDGETGFVTTFGKVRELNTTGSSVGETWAMGDILYASPSNAGGFTKVKPTAPNNVLPAAAVLSVSATEGEIFVRPTFEQKQDYGRFSSTIDQTALSANTAYAISFNNTLVSNGITLTGTPSSRLTVSQSGFYQFDFTVQLSSTNSSSKNARIWIRKNGTENVPNSSRIFSLDSNSGFTVASIAYSISLNANEYVEIMYAMSDNALYLHAVPATAYAPAAPSILLSATQVQL